MSQEFHVLQCFNCETYQVDIVKKVPKWGCKMCGEKQSLKKVYGKGNGKECRLLVQSLNEHRLSQSKVCTPFSASNDDCSKAREVPEPSMTKTSKWAEFLDDTDDTAEHKHSVRKASGKWEQFTHVDETYKTDNPCSVSTQVCQTSTESELSPESQVTKNIFEDDVNNLDEVLAL